MDEKLFSPSYWDDVDLSYRAQKRGLTIIWEPTAVTKCDHECAVAERIRERNRLLFIWKNLTSKNLFKKHISGLIKRTVKSPGYLAIILSTIPKLALVIKKHKKEVKESKVSDEAVFIRFNN